ncbi:MAG: stage III sporulation AC/AD family protein [Oscillospiraceae bacterium]|nr:stage III sporulation AC/AD family protein [Oscillospiraceae bacterium]
MELVLKASAAALTAAIVCLLIKRGNPEISLLLSICTVSLILIAALGFAEGIRELATAVKTVAGSSETLAAPVLKCVAIAIVTRVTAELCRDSSQGASAAAVELAGTICAMSVALPLTLSMLNMIGGMV